MQEEDIMFYQFIRVLRQNKLLPFKEKWMDRSYVLRQLKVVYTVSHKKLVNRKLKEANGDSINRSVI